MYTISQRIEKKRDSIQKEGIKARLGMTPDKKCRGI